MSEIAERIQQVRERMTAAARRANRSPGEITLMAVSKTGSPDRILQAYKAGLRVFGENRVQEFVGKRPFLNDLQDAKWTMIGHLQSNKAAKAAELFDAIHSVDSPRLLERLNAGRKESGRTALPALIEINIGEEEAKAGLPPSFEQLQPIFAAAAQSQHVQIRGLMTVPPYTEDPEGARPYFRRLRELRDEIARHRLPGIAMEELSMGMSHDFEIAIEEGSTCVRIGTAIFGERPRP